MALSPRRRGEDVSIYMYFPGRKRLNDMLRSVFTHKHTHRHFYLVMRSVLEEKEPPTSESSTSYNAVWTLFSCSTNKPSVHCVEGILQPRHIVGDSHYNTLSRTLRIRVSQTENQVPTQNQQSYSEFILSHSRRFEGHRERTNELTKSSMARGWSCIV